MLLIIKFIELFSILYNNLIVFRAITLLYLIIPMIDIGLGRFYIKININILLII